MAIDGFLSNLDKEIGYKFGQLWRYNDQSLGVVVPILKHDGKEFPEREYITLEETKDKGISFKETGRIDRIIVQSSLEKSIFIRSGTALKSLGTQPRAVESSVVIIDQKPKQENQEGIIPPIVTQEINVRCIHSSKPIVGGTGFAYAGDVPNEVRSALLSKSGQRETWSAVSRSTNRFMGQTYRGQSMKTMRLMTDLVGVMEEVDKFTENIDEILAKVPLFENQVGSVFLDMKDVVGLEMFDHPKSWESIHKEVDKRLGESLTKEEDNSFFKPDYERVKPLIHSFLNKLLESDKKEYAHGITSTISINGDGIVGEATTINGKVIHLVVLRSDKEKKSDKKYSGAIRNNMAERISMIQFR